MKQEIFEPRGIGGWLVLPLIALIVTPLRMIVSLLVDVLPVFDEGVWQIATVPGNVIYHPLWAPLIIFEIAANVVLILLDIVLLVMFLKKRRLTPRLMIVWLGIALAVQIVDVILAAQIPIETVEVDWSDYKEPIFTAVFCAIWIPYFLVSQRVKNTFVA